MKVLVSVYFLWNVECNSIESSGEEIYVLVVVFRFGWGEIGVWGILIVLWEGGKRIGMSE